MLSETNTGDSHRSLAEFVDGLQASGRYTFTRDEALAAVGVSERALKQAASRLARKRRLVAPRRGFFVVVPLEYRSAGAPPPPWFIDELMRYQGGPTTSRSCRRQPCTAPRTSSRKSSRWSPTVSSDRRVPVEAGSASFSSATLRVRRSSM